jgi:hypothetical protein
VWLKSARSSSVGEGEVEIGVSVRHASEGVSGVVSYTILQSGASLWQRYCPKNQGKEVARQKSTQPDAEESTGEGEGMNQLE